MSDLYVSRPQQVEAIQWDGTTEGTIVAGNWAPGKVRWTPGDDAPWCLELLAGKDGAQEWVPVPVGHWLVHPPGDTSDIWPVDPDYFAAKYQPASPQPDTAPEGQWTVDIGYKVQDGIGALIACYRDTLPNDGLAERVAAALNGAPATPAERAVLDAESDADLIARLLWRASGWLDDDFEEKGSIYRTRMRRELTEAERVLVAEVRWLRPERNQNDG